MTNMTKVFIGLPFILFPLICSQIDKNPYEWGLILTLGIEAVAVYAYIRYQRNKQKREDLNRFDSVFIVGMHPVTNEIPALPRFAEHCEFVRHKDVDATVRYWEDRLQAANNRHGAKVYRFSFMEPVDENAVNEYFSADQGENNYPARICREIEKDRAEVHVRQYKADRNAYRGEVMNQRVEWGD